MKGKSTMPPKLFLRFFRWYCRPGLRDHIEGDLIEEYIERIKTSGKRKADRIFIIDVLLLFRPGIIRPIEYRRINTYGMYKNYLKIGWRNLLRQKGYSFINIGGLSIGMTVALLNGLWIWYEFSFNKYFDHYDRIAHVAERGLNLEEGGYWTGTTMTYPLSTALIDQYHQHFRHIVRTSWDVDCVLSADNKIVSAKGLYAGKAAPHMFTFRMIEGTRDGLADMHSIVISSSLARILYGTENPLNRTLLMNNRSNVTVTGVYEDFPQDTRFHGKQFFATWELFENENKWIEQRAINDWRNHFLQIYVEILPGTSFESVSAKVKSVLRFDPEDMEMAAKGNRELFLYPMSRWHLYPPRNSPSDTEPIDMLLLIAAIGVFVLLLACINFMNLSTARAERRAKEVGIRKTIGSVRSQLIHQFFSESFLVVMFSFLLALVLSSACLPWFNDITGKQIIIPWSNIWFWLSGFGFIMLTSLLAGSYPALYLSSFNPIKALKGTFRAGRFAAVPRKVLVVFQFSISVILIIGTIIVYQQIQYAKNRPVGYDREGLIMIQKKNSDFYGKYDMLRHELKKTGAVFEVSESMGPVTETWSNNNGWQWKGRDPNIDESFVTLAVSHLHGKTAGWQFVSGRDFDQEIANDSSGVVINEAAARFMGLESPVGEPISWTWWVDKRVMNYRILGVIKDMVMGSPYAPVRPAVFYLKGFNGTPSWINVKINPSVSMSEALPGVEAVFRKLIPTAPFEYQFADDAYAKKFASEERIGKLASVFAALAIFISCLGLLGLASFVAERRTKEIGIRKVLGASVAGLWKMLSKDFVLLIVISSALAGPLAYYFLDSWLQKFDYRTTISVWTFIWTSVAAVIITLMTVSYQAIRAALSNPVKSLRSE